jgi:quercetin dioxygenase-like cupin family protein
MRFRSLAVLTSFTLIPAAVVGIASATAPSGVTPVAHVSGAKLPGKVKVDADGIKFQAKAPTRASVLTLTVDPGGSTGWHTHPGLAVISVTRGTGTLYSTDCSSRTFKSGSAFVESGDDEATLFRNEGSTPVVLTVTFIAPRGAAIIRDEPAPGSCGRR